MTSLQIELLHARDLILRRIEAECVRNGWSNHRSRKSKHRHPHASLCGAGSPIIDKTPHLPELRSPRCAAAEWAATNLQRRKDEPPIPPTVCVNQYLKLCEAHGLRDVHTRGLELVEAMRDILPGMFPGSPPRPIVADEERHRIEEERRMEEYEKKLAESMQLLEGRIHSESDPISHELFDTPPATFPSEGKGSSPSPIPAGLNDDTVFAATTTSALVLPKTQSANLSVPSRRLPETTLVKRAGQNEKKATTVQVNARLRNQGAAAVRSQVEANLARRIAHAECKSLAHRECQAMQAVVAKATVDAQRQKKAALEKQKGRRLPFLRTEAVTQTAPAASSNSEAIGVQNQKKTGVKQREKTSLSTSPTRVALDAIVEAALEEAQLRRQGLSADSIIGPQPDEFHQQPTCNSSPIGVGRELWPSTAGSQTDPACQSSPTSAPGKIFSPRHGRSPSEHAAAVLSSRIRLAAEAGDADALRKALVAAAELHEADRDRAARTYQEVNPSVSPTTVDGGRSSATSRATSVQAALYESPRRHADETEEAIFAGTSAERRAPDFGPNQHSEAQGVWLGLFHAPTSRDIHWAKKGRSPRRHPLISPVKEDNRTAPQLSPGRHQSRSPKNSQSHHLRNAGGFVSHHIDAFGTPPPLPILASVSPDRRGTQTLLSPCRFAPDDELDTSLNVSPNSETQTDRTPLPLHHLVNRDPNQAIQEPMLCSSLGAPLPTAGTLTPQSREFLRHAAASMQRSRDAQDSASNPSCSTLMPRLRYSRSRSPGTTMDIDF